MKKRDSADGESRELVERGADRVLSEITSPSVAGAVAPLFYLASLAIFTSLGTRSLAGKAIPFGPVVPTLAMLLLAIYLHAGVRSGNSKRIRFGLGASFALITILGLQVFELETFLVSLRSPGFLTGLAVTFAAVYRFALLPLPHQIDRAAGPPRRLGDGASEGYASDPQKEE